MILMSLDSEEIPQWLYIHIRLWCSGGFGLWFE